MTQPAFLDSAIRFSATVPQHALLDREDITWLASLPFTSGLTDAQRHVLATMRHGAEWTNRSLREFLPMDSTKARQLLTDLVERGLAVAEGEGRGRGFLWCRPPRTCATCVCASRCRSGIAFCVAFPYKTAFGLHNARCGRLHGVEWADTVGGCGALFRTPATSSMSLLLPCSRWGWKRVVFSVFIDREVV